LEQTADTLISLPLERSGRILGTDELNICEFPLTSTGRGSAHGDNTLIFEDDIFDEGSKQTVHRKLIVSASEAFGLPTPADSDVLLVLMHLTNERNGFTDRTVHFTRYELVKFLGWDQSGKSYRRLEEALHRWVNITLNYNRAWWDRSGRRWATKSFHILESVDLRGRGDGRDDGTSSLTWNQVIFDSFQSNHVKRLDLDTYFRLKSPAARQAYRFLDKRFYRSKLLEFDLRSFACEHVGLSRNYDNGQLKRKLLPAISELEEIGFLKPLPEHERYTKRKKGDWVIKLIRESAQSESQPVELTSSVDPLIEELTKRGVHAGTARELVEQFAPDRIRAKLEILDWLIAQGGERAPKNPAGYLASAIRNDYQAPSDFRARHSAHLSRPQVTPKSQPSKPAAESEEYAARLNAAKLRFQSLCQEEQKRVEDLAVASGNRFRVDTYKRLQKNGGKLFEEVRDLLIADYFAKDESEQHAG